MASTVFRWLRRAAILAVAGFVVWQAVAAAEDVLPPGDDALQRATMKITGRQSGDAGDDHAPGAGVAAPGEPNAGSATPSELPLGPGRPAASTLSAGGAGSEITLAGDPVAQNPTGESRAPVPGEASGASPLQPIPDPHAGGPVEIEAASFNGIVPGVSTMDEVQKAWGAPKDAARRDGRTVHLHAVPPFDRVEVSYAQNRVAAIVIRLGHAVPAAGAAQQLQLAAVRPVLVSSALGEILGQSYPERGVLFSFQPNDPPYKPSYKVVQIILEPISAEPFLLRAETHLDSRPDWSAKDLETAVRLDPANGRAHWLQARVLSASGDQTRALAAVGEAVRLEPDNPQYRVTQAQVLGQQGQFIAAAQEAEKALATSDKRPHVKARALCLLGDLYGSGRHPDYKQAMTYHSDALKAADALSSSPHPAIRIAAKEVLVDAHLGAAHDIAWGNWDRKEVAVPRWLEKAASLADDLVDKEGATPERRFRVGVRALAALVGLQGRIEPTPWAERTVRSADELLSTSTDPGRTQQLQWDLGMALYDAVQIYQMRGEHDQALKYGQKAIAYLEQGTSAKQDAADSYLLGRLYFRVGAIYAVGQQNHRMAASWYDKAVVIFDRLANDVNPGEFGRLGETYVSMGVSYWQIGQREKALELTLRGTGLIEKVVDSGALEAGALEIPYANLATMHRQMGQGHEADLLLQKASKAKDTFLR
jgi:tetratricopeptide (TPR) repeat protein